MVNSSKVDFLAHRALMKAVYGEVHPCGRLVQKEDYGRINPAVLREFYAGIIIPETVRFTFPERWAMIVYGG